MFDFDRERLITSKDNPFLKHVQKLFRDKSYRFEHREFMIEGYKIFDSAAGVRTLILRENAALPAGLRVEVPVVTFAERIFDRLSDTGTGQGVMAVCAMPSFSPPEATGRYVYLDGIQDPGNLGTILRTAAAFGLNGVLFGKGCADHYSPKVVRSAAGAVFRISMHNRENPAELSGFRLIAAEAGGTALEEFPVPADYVLVIGSEGRGISSEVKSLCSAAVSIPMPGGMESLNAAVSAGIILYRLSGAGQA